MIIWWLRIDEYTLKFPHQLFLKNEDEIYSLAKSATNQGKNIL